MQLFTVVVYLLSEQRSIGQHRCVTPLYVIPMWNLFKLLQHCCLCIVNFIYCVFLFAHLQSSIIFSPKRNCQNNVNIKIGKITVIIGSCFSILTYTATATVCNSFTNASKKISASAFEIFSAGNNLITFGFDSPVNIL